MKGNNHRGNCHSNDVTTAWRIGRPLPDSVVAIHSRWLAIRRWVPFMGRTFVLNNFTTRITYRIALIVGNNFGKIEWNMCYVFSAYPCYFLLFYLILSFFFPPSFQHIRTLTQQWWLSFYERTREVREKNEKTKHVLTDRSKCKHIINRTSQRRKKKNLNICFFFLFHVLILSFARFLAGSANKTSPEASCE